MAYLRPFHHISKENDRQLERAAITMDNYCNLLLTNLNTVRDYKSNAGQKWYDDKRFKVIIMSENTRVTEETINWLLDTADKEEAILHGKTLVVDYGLTHRAGFTVTGRAAVVDPANFDIEIGRKVARENAAHQVWQLEGYLKQLTLAGLIAWVGE